MKKITVGLILISSILISACAFDVIRIEQIPTKLVTDTQCDNFIELASDTNIDIGHGYTRTLKNGTRWHCVGKLPQGSVFNTRDQVLTIEASNIYEANIVVSSATLVGFYLPVEEVYVPLKSKVRLQTQ